MICLPRKNPLYLFVDCKADIRHLEKNSRRKKFINSRAKSKDSIIFEYSLQGMAKNYLESIFLEIMGQDRALALALACP